MKKIYTLMLLYIFSASIFGQEVWTKHEGPVLEKGPEGSWDEDGPGFPSVLLINETYHLWYAASGNNILSIGHATSDDGITWTKDENNPVLDLGEDGSWDDGRVYVPKVVYDGSSYHMWYNGSGGTGGEQIGYATSPDGSTWARYEGNPVLPTRESGAWDSGNTGPGGVYFDGENFHMWYAGNAFGAHGVFNVGYASSADGISWSRSDLNPVLESESSTWEKGRVSASSVLLDSQGKYHMWYDGGDFAKWRIGYATSTDGLSWTKAASMPVLDVGGAGSWDSEFVSFPTVLLDSAARILQMWFYGADAESGAIGYAESSIINQIGTLKKLPDLKLTIFPNPASKLITLRSEVLGVKSIEIISLNGQLMYSAVMEGNEMQADVSWLNNGLYLLRIKSKTSMKTIKLVKL